MKEEVRVEGVDDALTVNSEVNLFPLSMCDSEALNK